MMTPQQQLTAFLNHCATLRQGYTFSFKQKKSSLRHFIAELEAQIALGRIKPLMLEEHEGALAALRQSSPKDHVKYLIAIQSLAAVWGTTKNYNRQAGNTNMPSQTQYWTLATGALGDIPTKISLTSKYLSYNEAVQTHLNALNQTTAGHTLLSAIAGNGKDSVGIVDHPLTNQCGAQGSTNGMNSVAKELFSDVETKLGPATLAALNQVAPPMGKTRAGWLADKINLTPIYKLKGVPATAPCHLGVTEGQVQAWLGGQSIWQDFGNDAQLGQIKNAVILALYGQATAGTGCSSMVNYTLGTANPLNGERPPAIGLAHELVHAYYNMLGIQPGFEVENTTTVLFEYRCVGLGPWVNAAVSENKIREEWDGAMQHFDDDDIRNRMEVDLRPYYSAP